MEWSGCLTHIYRMRPNNKYARHAVEFINNLTLVGDHSNEKMKLVPFQEQIIRKLFGTRDKDGKFQYNKCLLYIPRGNAKSTLACQILIYSLLGLPRHGQQILSCGMSTDQAAIVFEYAKQIIEQDPYLLSLVDIIPSKKRIVVPHKHSLYAAVANDPKRKLGYAPSIVTFDELQSQENRKLFDAITTSFGKRKNWLLVMMMTAGEERNSLAYEELSYARKVQAGIIDDPHYLPILFEADESEDWTSEETWRKCNPGLEYGFPDLDFLRQECEQAKHIPARESIFKKRYLNLWQSKSNAWLSDNDWMECAEPPLLDPETKYVAGLDAAAVEDTFAFVLYGKTPDGNFNVIPFFWVAEDRVAKRSTKDFNYPEWVRKGFLRTTPGAVTDQEFVLHQILDICDEYKITKIGVDRWGMMGYFGPKLLEHGIDVGQVGQSYQHMSEPLKTIERQVLAGKLRHGGHPVLRWQVSNCQLVTDASDNYRICKRSSKEKVDSCQALATAVYCYDDSEPFADGGISYA